MLAAVAATLSMSLASHARADSFDLTAQDKQAHVAASYGITLTVDVIARRFELPRWQAVLIGAATAIVIGTTKELAFDTDYDWGDQLANGIGIAGATGLVLAFEL